MTLVQTDPAELSRLPSGLNFRFGFAQGLIALRDFPILRWRARRQIKSYS